MNLLTVDSKIVRYNTRELKIVVLTTERGLDTVWCILSTANMSSTTLYRDNSAAYSEVEDYRLFDRTQVLFKFSFENT